MTRMTGFAFGSGLIVLVLGLGLAAVGSASSPSIAQASKGDVVLIACTGGGTDFKLTAYQGSPGTPAKKSPSCAENLSVLVKEGFAIRDIGQNDAEKSGLVVFTLVR